MTLTDLIYGEKCAGCPTRGENFLGSLYCGTCYQRIMREEKEEGERQNAEWNLLVDRIANQVIR